MYQALLLADLKLHDVKDDKIGKLLFDVIYEDESQVLGKINGQERCKDLQLPFSRSPLKDVTIINSQVLFKATTSMVEEKEIREIILDFQDFKEYGWQPGDTIAILPTNSTEHVEELIELLHFENKADTVCSVVISKLCPNKTAKVPTYIPSKTTPREILRDCLNLESTLKKMFLRKLADYCSTLEEKQALKCLSSKAGSVIYNSFVIKNGLTLIELLRDFPSCKPPFGLIIEYMSRLLPRPYSIANSPLKTNDKISFIFSTLAEKAGVTTKMLKEKCSDATSSLLIYLRESNYFRYTENEYHRNQFFIGIGTGIAPFLGFLQHKQYMKNGNKKNPGITWLFAGTTTQQSVVHREDLLKWHSENVLDNYVESFSRNPKARFHYVQEALHHNAKEVVDFLMQPDTSLYLCADGGQISSSIEMSLQDILCKELSIDETESIKLLQDFKAKGKYREDIWL